MSQDTSTQDTTMQEEEENILYFHDLIFYLTRSIAPHDRGKLRQLITEHGGKIVSSTKSNAIELVTPENADGEKLISYKIISDSINAKKWLDPKEYTESQQYDAWLEGKSSYVVARTNGKKRKKPSIENISSTNDDSQESNVRDESANDDAQRANDAEELSRKTEASAETSEEQPQESTRSSQRMIKRGYTAIDDAYLLQYAAKKFPKLKSMQSVPRSTWIAAAADGEINRSIDSMHERYRKHLKRLTPQERRNVFKNAKNELQMQGEDTIRFTLEFPNDSENDDQNEVSNTDQDLPGNPSKETKQSVQRGIQEKNDQEQANIARKKKRRSTSNRKGSTEDIGKPAPNYSEAEQQLELLSIEYSAEHVDNSSQENYNEHHNHNRRSHQSHRHKKNTVNYDDIIMQELKSFDRVREQSKRTRNISLAGPIRSDSSLDEETQINVESKTKTALQHKKAKKRRNSFPPVRSDTDDLMTQSTNERKERISLSPAYLTRQKNNLKMSNSAIQKQKSTKQRLKKPESRLPLDYNHNKVRSKQYNPHISNARNGVTSAYLDREDEIESSDDDIQRRDNVQIYGTNDYPSDQEVERLPDSHETQLIYRIQFETQQDVHTVVHALYYASGKVSTAIKFLHGQHPIDFWSPKEDKQLYKFLHSMESSNTELTVANIDEAITSHGISFRSGLQAQDIIDRISFLRQK